MCSTQRENQAGVYVSLAGRMTLLAEKALPMKLVMKHARWPTTLLRRARRLLLFAPLLSLALAFWACGATPAVTHQPASRLRLTVSIIGQFTSDDANVLVDVRLYEGANGMVAFAPGGARLTCNGSDVKPDYQTFQRKCPRSPQGGVYTFIYTDEHGVVTTATIPVPRGRLALLSPRAGATVLIPGSRPVSTATPYVAPSPTLYVVPTPYDPSATAPIRTPVPGPGLTLAYEAPAALHGGSVTLSSASAECGDWKISNCGDQVFQASDDPANATTSGGKQSIHMVGDFSQFQPGPGAISLSTTIQATVADSGFAGLMATFTDNLRIPITWTR